MKNFVIAFVLILLVIGCSKKEENRSTGLGKDVNYFSNLYGPAKSQKRVSEYDFSLPSVGHLIKLNESFVIQQYASGKLNITVIFLETSPHAIWVKYTLPNPWTQEQIKAALGAYDNKWTATNSNTGVASVGAAIMKSLMPDQTPSTFQSNSGILAYKTIEELMFYSPALFQDLRQKMADEEQQKRAVPKF
ncbi:MAG: hypothetical protein ABSD77_06940 [Verrucomicrobiota bacterium]|jgi:hypothetical protein